MAILSGNGIAPHVVERVLEFLNNAPSAEYFTSLPYLHNYLGDHDYDPATAAPISVAVANDILAARTSLGGTFTDLSQLSNITGFGEPEFYELIQFFSGHLSRKSGPMPKVDLLSFMTVHTPEALRSDSVSDLFVTRNMDGNVKAAVARVPMNNLPTLQAFQAQYAPIWDWSQYLKDNRSTLKARDLPALATANSINRNGMSTAWEVLAHTFDSGREDTQIREAASMVIVGNHVLSLFERAQQGDDPALSDDLHWRRLANAKIVLPL